MYGEVLRTQRLTPDLIRVVLGGEGLDDFAPVADTDAYVNCSFLPEGAPYSVPFDEAAVRDLPREQRPNPRRFTVRAWDPIARELTLDFVVHGETGYAGRWALHAAPGDRLQFKGPGAGYVPHAEADSYLFVGDECALPAIAASAEAVPAGRPVVVVAEIAPGGELELTSPGDLTVHWIHRTSEPDLLLADAVAALPPLPGRVSAFVHGEAMETREVRRVLLTEKLVEPEWLSCSPYWRRGMTDEEWRSIKKDFTRETEQQVPLR